SQLELFQNVTITGPADRSVEITGNNFTTNVFFVDASVTARLRNLVITAGAGGYSVSASLYFGGALPNSGTTTLDHSALANNTAITGGAIVNNAGGTLTISGSTLSGNSSGGGGAISNQQGTITISNSTISGNTALNEGGGIYNASTLEITNSTISGNVV